MRGGAGVKEMKAEGKDGGEGGRVWVVRCVEGEQFSLTSSLGRDLPGGAGGRAGLGLCG